MVSHLVRSFRPSRRTEPCDRYYRRIEEFMVDGDIAEGIRSHSAVGGDRFDDWQSIHAIMESLGYLLYVEDIDDLSEAKVSHELRMLQEKYREQEIQAITDRLEKLNYHLKNDSDVAAVAGSRRPELVRSGDFTSLGNSDSGLGLAAYYVSLLCPRTTPARCH